MSPRYIIGAALAVALILGSLVGYQSCRTSQGSAAEVQANIASGAANVHQSQAQASDALEPNLKAKLADQTVILARVTGERDALRKQWAARPVPPDALPPAAPDDRPALLEQLDLASAVIEKDAAMIDNQSKVIETQALTIGTLTVSRNEWKLTAEARERQALAQEAATRAWKSAVTSSKWIGRAQGFAAGVALGYAGGKR